LVSTHGAGDKLRCRCAAKQYKRPDENKLERIGQVISKRQQPKHDQPKAKIIRLGQRMHTAERIPETQQPKLNSGYFLFPAFSLR
jgi:hypothetical protein